MTGDPFQAALGPAWNAEMRAAVDAMHELGVTWLAVAAPVADVKSRPVAAYLDASGFDGLDVEGTDIRSSRDILALPFEAPNDLAMGAFRGCPWR